MKKIIANIVILFMAATLCLAQPVCLDICLDEEFENGGEYGTVSVCYFMYDTVRDLTNRVSHIYKGTVTGISFAIRPLIGEQRLYTVYEVQIQAVYKGKLPDTVYIKVPGGLPGYREAEQRALAAASDGPFFTTGRYRRLGVGKSYLFCTVGNGEEQNIVNVEQFSFSERESNYEKMLQYVILSRWFDFEGFKEHLEYEHRMQQLRDDVAG